MTTTTPPQPGSPERLELDALSRATLGAALGAVLERLDQLAHLAEERPTHIAFGGSRHIPQRLSNWPVHGHDRMIVPSRAYGSLTTITAGAVPASAVALLDFDAGRAGLSIVNYGGGQAFLFLCDPGDAQTGAGAVLPLSPGASWDGKMSDVLWCGSVSGASAPGTTLAIAAI